MSIADSTIVALDEKMDRNLDDPIVCLNCSKEVVLSEVDIFDDLPEWFGDFCSLICCENYYKGID